MTEPALTDSPVYTAPHQPSLIATLFGDDRIVLPIGSLIVIGLLLGGLGVVGAPAWPGRAGLLMQQPNAVLLIAATIVLTAVGSLLASVIASHRHYEGGVFCGAAALATLAYKCGPMRYALFAASGRGIFFSATMELILLFVAIAAPAFVLAALAAIGWLPRDSALPKDEPIDQKLLAVAIHAVAMVLLMMLLCATDRIFQALASVFVAGYVASLLSRAIIPISPSLWLLAGPMLAGVLGYVLQGFTATGFANGDPFGLLAALGRATPLAYAGAGTMGTLLGYWHAVDRQEMTPAQLAADIAFGTAEVLATAAK